MYINAEDIINAYVTKDNTHRLTDKIFKTINGVWQLIYENFAGCRVTYNANGGYFSSGEATNIVYYDKAPKSITKISKTSNVSDDGLTANTTAGYGNQTFTDVVTIPGASSLQVKITYQTYRTHWVCVYDSSVTPSDTNYTQSITKKLSNSIKTTKSVSIPGDTAQIYFNSTSTTGTTKYYGYYATITGSVMVASVYEGTVIEPVHDNPDYIFAGWCIDPEGNTRFDPTTHTEDRKYLTVYASWAPASLKDFVVTTDGGLYNIIDWKGTLNGVPSTELVIPDDSRIVL